MSSEIVGIRKFIGILKSVIPEFNDIQDEDLLEIKDPSTRMLPTMCNMLELSMSTHGHIPEDVFGHTTRTQNDRFIIQVDLNKVSDKLIKYAQLNELHHPLVISKVLNTAVEDRKRLTIPDGAYLTYEPGVWVLVINKDSSTKDLPNICRFDMGDDKLAIMFNENTRSRKINNPPEKKTRDTSDLDDISWDVLYNISKPLTRYLYHLPVVHLAIHNTEESVVVYVRTAEYCELSPVIPTGWELARAEDTVFKFRMLIPRTEMAMA